LTANFNLAESGKSLETIRELFREYEQYIGVDLCFQDFENELKSLPGAYSRPQGRLYLIESAGETAGCAALRKFDDTGCEMKRLYVREKFRGRGLGRQAAELIVAEARKIGYERMMLDTLGTMTEAITLYESLGFKKVPEYRENPIVGAVFMEMKL